MDTGREVSTTWNYLHGTLNPYLARCGIAVEVVPHTFARVDLFTKNGEMVMPAYTTTGRLSPFCSSEWKGQAMQRWLRSKGVKTCTQWLGFSLDESRRASGKAHRPWCQPAYPLLDLRLTRGDCVRLIQKAGLPLPSKSRCWMCPHQNAAEWAEIKANPAEWAAAVALDEKIRESDQAGDVFLHPSRKPLALVEPLTDETPSLFRHCDDAGCFT